MSRHVPGLIAAYFALGLSPLQSQETSACTADALSDPARVLYHCPQGLVIEAEALAILDPAPSADQDPTGAIALKDGAVLIELEPGLGPFQILTPYAIASVRGTVFVVDAQQIATSVFVVDGIVTVSRDDGTEEIALVAGQGIEVSAETAMQVKTWPPDKVSALLARFAR